MQAHTVERVESWDSRPFSGGFRELHDLADREFSGAVVADDSWLFMLNGRVIGVFEGDIDDFGEESGTVYEAPHPSVALLFSMQERGGETQAKYYTNDTKLSQADDTLSAANFTGYVELSENVLSGNYYVVYYGGRSMSAAFVGASTELVTGDDAFERANDEVGVYEVKKTPVNVTNLPDVRDDDETAAAGAAGAGGAATGDSEAERGDDVDVSPSSQEPGADDENPADPAAESLRSDVSASNEADRSSDDAADAPTNDAGASTSAGSDARDGVPTGTAAESALDDESSTAGDGRAGSPSGAGGNPERETDTPSEPGEPPGNAGNPEETERVFDEEQEWRNAKSVPTLDPEKSESTDGGASREQSSDAAGNREGSPTSGGNAGTQSRSDAGRKSRSDPSGKPRSTVEKLKRAVTQRDEKLEQASERIGDLQSERDQLRERVQTLEAERDQLRTQIAELEAELEAVDADGGDAAAAAGVDLSRDEALSGTNLFVRYDSKGKPTLDGLNADTDPEAVNENLRIDHHTTFDAADATVDGEDYEAFLESTGAYQFVSWAVRELPFEIRDSGHASGLVDLVEAIPAVDRAELDGVVDVETEEGTTSRTFDVVLRDRMGELLVVADLNAKREPVTGDEMEALVDAATTVREGVDELSAAMYVTASFFEPAALETTAAAAGGGGFLGRSDQESFVTVGRKAGYHLCLVEDRNDAFHLTVPEL